MRYGFILKAPFDLYFLDDDNKKLSNIILDSNNLLLKWLPLDTGRLVSSSGEFTLSSCCIGPRFYFKDFEMLKNLDPSLRPAKTIQKLI